MELDRYETARRMRALRGYSLMSQAEFAEALGITKDAAERYMRTKGPTRAPDQVLRNAARLAGLREDFALGEFGASGQDGKPLTREDVLDLIELEVASAMRRGGSEPEQGLPETGDPAS